MSIDSDYFDEASKGVPAPPVSAISTDFEIKNKPREATRRHLAVGLLVLLSILAIGGEAAFVFGLLEATEFRDLSTVFTPVMTLAGAAFGFFFGREGGSDG